MILKAEPGKTKFVLLMLCIFCLCPALLSVAGEKILLTGFPPGSQNPDTLNAGLPAGEYGYHPDSDSSWGESWSVQAANDAGDFIYILMSISNYVPFHKYSGTVDIFYYPAAGGKYHSHGEFKSDQVSADKNKVSVNIGGNTFSGVHPNYSLKVAQKDLSCDLKFTVPTSSLRIGQKKIFFGKNKERYWNLNALAPRAKVTGTITHGGKQIPFNGRAYFDHGWSTEKIYKFSKRWYVLRMVEDDFSFNVIRMNMKSDYSPRTTQAIFITEGDKILANSGAVQLTPQGSVTDPKSGLSLPDSYRISYDRGGVKLNGTVKMKRRVEGLNVLDQLSPMLQKIIKALVTDPWQFRFEGQADLVLERNGQTRKINGQVVGEVHHYN